MSAPSAPRINSWPSCSTGQIRFYWEAPTSDGGSPITQYTLACTSIAYSQDLSANVYDYLVTGLSNQTNLAFTITATNANGTGPAASFPIVQAGLQTIGPSIATLSTLNTSTAYLTWTPSTLTGEAALRAYLIQCFPSTTGMSSFFATQYPHKSTMAIAGLSTNIYYQFLVRGVNDVGYCPPFAYTSTVAFGLNPFSPSSIANMGLWLDANDPYRNGTTPSSSTIISTLYDKSGQNRNAVSGTSLIETNSLNSKATIKFTSSSFYNITYASFPTSYSMYAVYQTTSTIGTFQRVINSSNAAYIFVGTGSESSNVATFAGNGTLFNDIDANSPTYNVLNRYGIVSLTNNNTTLRPYINGSNQNTKVGTTGVFSNFILGRVPSGLQQFHGNLAEIIMYTSNMSTDDRQKVEGYLAWKWGLQSNLQSSHPYRSNAPLA